MTGNSLQQLIGSCKLDVFLREHWEREFLFLDKFGVEVSDVLDISDIDFVLSRQAISYPFIRLVKHGKEIPLADYLRKPFDAEFRLIDSDKVLSFYSDGATVILQRAHLWIEKLAAFTDKLQKDLHFPVNCNVYITPSQSKGFEPHFDTHDVFILQIDGEKVWNLYNTPTPLPLETESLTKERSGDYLKEKPTHELTLQEGNLLYVPRGLVHDTFTRSKRSIHVTLGIFPPRGVDLFKAITTAASKLEFFKKSIARGVENKEMLMDFSKSLSGEFLGVIKQFTDTEITTFIATSFIGVPAQDNHGRFQDILLLESIKPETQVYRRERISFIISKSPGKLALAFYDKTIVFPDYVYESITFILSHSSFAVKEIAGCLNVDAKLVLVRKLVKEGFLALSDF